MVRVVRVMGSVTPAQINGNGIQGSQHTQGFRLEILTWLELKLDVLNHPRQRVPLKRTQIAPRDVLTRCFRDSFSPIHLEYLSKPHEV
jgi:hypothetical protein